MSIELVNVSKAFGETQVLRGLSERFAQGEAVCVMGRSGLGKTTLARIVMGLEKPDAGAVRGAKGKRFAAAFQEDRLVERLSAQGNLRFACGAALAKLICFRMRTWTEISNQFHEKIMKDCLRIFKKRTQPQYFQSR